MHEPGDKTILGQALPRARRRGRRGRAARARAASVDGAAISRRSSRGTSSPTIRRAKLVERLADVYLENDGELDERLSRADRRERELARAAREIQDAARLRDLDVPLASACVPENLQPVTAFLTQAGQRPYTPGSPAGWPDTAANWNGGDALLKRIEFAAAAGRRIGDRIEPLHARRRGARRARRAHAR